MDLADRAQLLEEAERADALARRAHRVARERAQRWRAASAVHCEAPGCGERIPAARRRALPGVRLCVPCQERAERAQRAAEDGRWTS